MSYLIWSTFLQKNKNIYKVSKYWKSADELYCEWIYHVNFPEFELVTEAESNFSNSTEDENVSESVNMDEKQLSKVLSSDTNDFSKEQLALIKELENKEDKQFQKFKKTIAKEPNQVLLSKVPIYDTLNFPIEHCLT